MPHITSRQPLRKKPLAIAIFTATLALHSGVILPLFSSASQASAQQAAKTYQIAPGPLGAVLSQFANEAGVVLSFDAALTNGKSSQGLQGSYSVEQGFATLLAGSDLRVIRAGDNYALEILSDNGSALELGATSVSATVENGITTEGTHSYTTSEVSMARGQKLKEIPQSVSVVTRQRIEDQGLTSVVDVLRQMPGVTVGGDVYYSSSGNFYSRGNSMASIQVDGYRDSTAASFQGGGNNISNLAMYDHIEVLRGSDGLYSGSGDSSGTINLVRKRPLDTFQGKVTASAGSWDNYRTEVDLTNSLGFDGKLRGRLVTAYQDTDSFQDFGGTQTDFLYGIIEADVTENTLLTLGGNYDHQDGMHEGGGFPTYYDGRSLDLSRSTNWTAPWSKKNEEKTNVFLNIKHEINEDWAVSGNINWTKYNALAVIGRIVDPIDPATNLTDTLSSYKDDLENTSTSYDLNVSGSGKIVGLPYQLLLGIDKSRSKYIFDGISTLTSLNIDINSIDMRDYAKPVLNNIYIYSGRSSETGAYSRFKVDLRDDIHVILGGRYTDYTGEAGLAWTGYSSESKWVESGIFTPYAGFIYDLNNDWSTYVSATKIYKSQANYVKGPFDNASPLDPLEGLSYEIGLKGDLYDGKATGSVAIYRTERTGEAVSDPLYSGGELPSGAACCYLNKGEVIAKGIELEINGDITPNLQLSASYVYNHNKDKESGEQYNTSTAPRHLSKIWGRYQLQGDWSKFAVGAGVTSQSETWSEGIRSGNSYKIVQPGYAVWGALAEYKITNDWQLALNLNNIFNKKYYSAISSSAFGNYYGAPRNYALTLRGTF